MSDTAEITPWREAAREAAFEGAQAELRARADTYPGLGAYRREHVRAVVRVAVRLAELTGADVEVVEAAAWLHDVSKVEAIEKHVGLTTTEPVEPLEAAILWDADKLTKLGATIVIHMSALLLASHLESAVTTEYLIKEWGNPAWGAVPLPYFHTEPAREAGWARYEALLAFAEQARREWTAEDLDALRPDRSKADLSGL
jgi:uncharacterized protein